MENIQIREILKSDIPGIAKMEAEIFSDPWSEGALLDSLGQSYVHFYGAYKEDKTVGYLIFSHIVDEVEIFRIAVKKSCRGEGIAIQLLEALKNFGKGQKAIRALLDVRENNVAAICLYKKAGFAEDGRRRDFYENPREDGILMSIDLS